MRRAARIDDNQVSIVDALRAAGCGVFIASGVGHGFPDLLVHRGPRVFMLEVKRGKGRLTEDQTTFRGLGWPVSVVRNAVEALAAVGMQITPIDEPDEIAHSTLPVTGDQGSASKTSTRNS